MMLVNRAREWVKDKLRSLIADLVRSEVQKTMEYMLPQLIQFYNSPKENRESYHNHGRDPLGNMGLFSSLKDRLLAVGVPVEEVDIDISDFECWLDEFSEIRKHYERMGDVLVEKCLEHYLAFRHLKISKDDVYIDIAAAGSPWASILNKKGIRSYRLDLAYPKGIHGINVGADAGDTNLSDGFCSVMSAQCAFECFMGDADVRFVKQVARVLNKKGRYGIVPLYLDDTYFVATSPYCDQNKVKIESEARKVWRDDEYKVPFSRFYSPESFQKRIYFNLPTNMTGKVLYFKNLADVIKHYKGQKIYCFFMFYCEKRRRNLNEARIFQE